LHFLRQRLNGQICFEVTSFSTEKMNAHVGKRKKESCLKKGHLVPLAALADPCAVLLPSGGQLEKNAFLQMHLALSRASSCKTKRSFTSCSFTAFSLLLRIFHHHQKRKNRKKRKSTIDIYNRLNMLSIASLYHGLGTAERQEIKYSTISVLSLLRAYLSKSLTKNGW